MRFEWQRKYCRIITKESEIEEVVKTEVAGKNWIKNLNKGKKLCRHCYTSCKCTTGHCKIRSMHK